jgi:transcriptional regulator with XRE-family HTH domain
MPQRKLARRAQQVNEDRVAADFWILMRLRRKEMEKSQREIAERLGIHTSTLCRWELQWVKRLPMPGKFWALADALELTDLEMLESAGYIGPAQGHRAKHPKLRVVK